MKQTADENPPMAPAARFSIRAARPDDAEMLVNLVHELAVYEKLEQNARARPDDFQRHLFGPRPAAEAALAEVDGQPVGFALWFTTFSTFRGQPGLYLEDLFVKPDYRGRGIGKGLLALSGRTGCRARVRATGMGGAELERTCDRLLPERRGATNGRVDGLPSRRRAAPPSRREREQSDSTKHPSLMNEDLSSMSRFVRPEHRPDGWLYTGGAAPERRLHQAQHQ